MINKMTIRDNSQYDINLLGTIIKNSMYLDFDYDCMVKDDFYHRKNYLIFSVLRDMTVNNIPVNLQTLVEMLQERRLLKNVGGEGYIASLTSVEYLPGHISYLIQKMKKENRRNRIIKLLSEGMEKLKFREGDVDINISEIVERLYSHIQEFNVDNSIEENLEDIVDMVVKKLDWIVDGFITRGSIVMIFGPPGLGKTFLATLLSFAIITGIAFLGMKCRKGKVLYILAEGNNTYKRRVAALEKYFGISCEREQFLVYNQALPLIKKDKVSKFISALKRRSFKPDLIVIDTLSRNFGSGKSQDNSVDMGSFIDACELLKREFNACILPIHHPGHQDTHRSRGSSTWGGAIDCSYQLKEDGPSQFLLISKKSKDFVKLDPIRFRSEEVVIKTVEGEDESSLVFTGAEEISRDSGKYKKITIMDNMADILLQISKSILSIDQVMYEWVKIDEWKEECNAKGIDRKRFSENKNRMLNENLIEICLEDESLVRPSSLL